MIFSCGCRTDAEALFCAKTSAKERLPRRPQGIGNSTMTKLANNENVTVEVMAKICTALNCKMDDIIDIIPDDKE